MGKQNFSKEKIQVQYKKVDLKFSEDDSVKAWGDESKNLIAQLKKETWDFDFALKSKKTEVDRIKGIIYPQIQNGHQGESGHDWQWQLDVKSKGKGSTDRLYLDQAKAEITKQTVLDKQIKVGTDQYTVIEVEVKVTGKFSADKKHP